MILKELVKLKRDNEGKLQGKSKDFELFEGVSVPIGKGNAELFVRNDICKICCYHGVKVNGIEINGGEEELHHRSLIELDTGQVFIFKDEDSEKERKKRSEVRIRSLKDVEQDKDTKSLKEEIKKKFDEFVKKNKRCSNIKKFARELCLFITNFTQLERAVLYQVKKLEEPKFIYKIIKGKRKRLKIVVSWKYLYGIAPEKNYRPSKKVLRDVYIDSAPTLIITREKEEYQLSRSIIENKIKTVMAFPIFNKDDEAIAIFYGDSSYKEIPEEGFLKVSYICSNLSPYLTCFSVLSNNLFGSPILKEPELNYKIEEPTLPVLKEINLENDGKETINQ